MSLKVQGAQAALDVRLVLDDGIERFPSGMISSKAHKLEQMAELRMTTLELDFGAHLNKAQP